MRQYYVCMNLGFSEMVFIFFIALIIFGPKKLPEIGRQLGKAINDFKRASNEFKAQIESEISKLETEPEKPVILPPARPMEGVVSSGSLEDSPVLHADSEPVDPPQPAPEATTEATGSASDSFTSTDGDHEILNKAHNA